MADKEVKKDALPAGDQMPDKKLIEQQEAELEKKNKWLYPTVITILILFFVVGFIYGLNTVLSMEGAYPDPILTESITPAPESPSDVVKFLRLVVDQAEREKPKFIKSVDFEIDDENIKVDMQTDGQDTLLKTLSYLTEDADDYLDDKLCPPADGDNDPNVRDFSVGFKDVFLEPDFSAEDIEADGFSCDYIRYRCISCGNEDTTQLDACEACGSEYKYQMVYRDNYEIAVDLKMNEDLIDKLFSPMKEEEIKTLLSEPLEGVADISSVAKEYKAIRVIFKVNRATNNLISLTYEKDLDLTMDVGFKDGFAALGSTKIVVPLTEKNVYDFIWPGVMLSDHNMSLEPKGKDNLTATLSCDDPTKYDANWSSSDPTVVQVDDEGYLTAGKKDGGTATITATFEFNGKWYSDSCEVKVKYSVESMKLNKKHLTLSVGDTATLTATVSPKKATEKGATWYTKDNDTSVVTIDHETGLITAVAPGTIEIYALSDDGAYKSSCEVTVK